jgi:hypothetical protein
MLENTEETIQGQHSNYLQNRHKPVRDNSSQLAFPTTNIKNNVMTLNKYAAHQFQNKNLYQRWIISTYIIFNVY